MEEVGPASGPELERIDVCRAHRPKVALIESRDLVFAHAFGQRDDAGIDDAKRQIGIPSLQLVASCEIDGRRRLDPVDPRQNIVEKDEPRFGRQPATAPVVDDEVLIGLRQQVGAAFVIRISSIECGQQRAGVADERHLARLFGDRVRCDFGGASAIGRTRHTNAWSPSAPQRHSLLLDGFSKERCKWNISSLRLRLQGADGGSRRVHGRSAEVRHDA
jgi:hypothetical protein